MSNVPTRSSDPALLLAGRVVRAADYLESPQAFQADLRRARDQFGHALCTCRQPHRKLVIRQLGHKLFLALWPDDGPEHALACPFFRAEDNVHPVATVATGADASAPVHFADALSRLLQQLWVAARLNVWARGWSRDWWRVRVEALRAAQQVHLPSSIPLADCLYVPPPFRRERAAEIERSWRDFLAPKVPGTGPPGPRLVLAEVKDWERQPQGVRLQLRHFAQHVVVAEDSELVRLLASAAPVARVIALVALDTACAGHVLGASNAAGLLCAQSYLPADTVHACALVDALAHAGRSVVVPLGQEPLDLPQAILEDVPSGPVALQVLGTEDLDVLERQLAARAGWRQEGLSIWTWRLSEAPIMPAVPAGA